MHAQNAIEEIRRRIRCDAVRRIRPQQADIDALLAADALDDEMTELIEYTGGTTA